MDMWWKIKPYISKIRNGFSLCIYDLEFSWFYTFQFLHPIIHLTTTTKKKKKKKTLDGHVAKNWTPIKIQFRI